MVGWGGAGWREKGMIVCFCSERVLFFAAAERRHCWVEFTSGTSHLRSHTLIVALGPALHELLEEAYPRLSHRFNTELKDREHQFTRVWSSFSQKLFGRCIFWLSVLRSRFLCSKLFWNSDWTSLWQNSLRLKESLMKLMDACLNLHVGLIYYGANVTKTQIIYSLCFCHQRMLHAMKDFQDFAWRETLLSFHHKQQHHNVYCLLC